MYTTTRPTSTDRFLEHARDEGVAGVVLRWAICDECQGEGTVNGLSHSNGLTGSEWAELEDGDPDFAENYYGGAYDVPCPECHRDGKVRVLDEEASSAEAREVWDEYWHELWAYEAERDAERRIGA